MSRKHWIKFKNQTFAVVVQEGSMCSWSHLKDNNDPQLIFFSYLATHKTAPTMKKVQHMLHIALVPHLAHVVVTKKWQICMCNTSSIPNFYRVSTRFFSKVPWLSLTFWSSSSLTFPDFSHKWTSYMVHTFFLSLNSRSFKMILMMYLYV